MIEKTLSMKLIIETSRLSLSTPRFTQRCAPMVSSRKILRTQEPWRRLSCSIVSALPSFSYPSSTNTNGRHLDCTIDRIMMSYGLLTTQRRTWSRRLKLNAIFEFLGADALVRSDRPERMMDMMPIHGYSQGRYIEGW